MTAATGVAIKLDQVTKAFTVADETIYAVREVSLAIAAGEFVALIGRSGSGKTTLLNLIAGLDRPTSGEVLIDGQPISALPERALTDLRRRRIGFIFQSFGLLPLLSAQENVELALRIAGAGRRERGRRAREVLAMMGLGRRANHRPYELSGGEQQRVAIARAIANQPALILADEPTGELDSTTATTIFRLLIDIARAEGITIVTSTHDRTVMELAPRVEELADGRLLAGDRAGLLDYATHRGGDHFRRVAPASASATPITRDDAGQAGGMVPAVEPATVVAEPRETDRLHWSRRDHLAAAWINNAPERAEPVAAPEPDEPPADDVDRWAPPERRT